MDRSILSPYHNRPFKIASNFSNLLTYIFLDILHITTHLNKLQYLQQLEFIFHFHYFIWFHFLFQSKLPGLTIRSVPKSIIQVWLDWVWSSVNIDTKKKLLNKSLPPFRLKLSIPTQQCLSCHTLP